MSAARRTCLVPLAYYHRAAVRSRLREFCGLGAAGEPTCIYLSALDSGSGRFPHWGTARERPPADLEALLESHPDLTRSMWDRRGLLVHLDIDYMNLDVPGEAFLHPADTLLKLESAYRAVMQVCDEWQMPLMDLLTGQGYNFVGQVALEGSCVARLAALCPQVPAWYASMRARRPGAAEMFMGESYAGAHHGLGLVIEHLAHRVLALSAPLSPVPVVVNNVPVGTGLAGRECVSIDLTHFGDPLDVRRLRVAFSLYQKHRLRPDIYGPELAERVPPLTVLPRRRGRIGDWIESGRGTDVAAGLARKGNARIPDVERGLGHLIDAYEQSAAAAFHRDFHSVHPHDVAEWPSTYDRLDRASLPPCVSASLEYPNDLLLQPGRIQLLVRVLLARGWHPRHVAGLVHSVYARDGRWGEHWSRIEPETRAEFDVRVFAGLIAVGLDEGRDLNCVSTREKGYCPGGSCGYDLRRDRDALVARGVP